MTDIRRQFRPAIATLVVLTIITGIIYPLVVTGIAQVVFPYQTPCAVRTPQHENQLSYVLQRLASRSTFS